MWWGFGSGYWESPYSWWMNSLLQGHTLPWWFIVVLFGCSYRRSYPCFSWDQWTCFGFGMGLQSSYDAVILSLKLHLYITKLFSHFSHINKHNCGLDYVHKQNVLSKLNTIYVTCEVVRINGGCYQLFHSLKPTIKLSNPCTKNYLIRIMNYYIESTKLFFPLLLSCDVMWDFKAVASCLLWDR